MIPHDNSRTEVKVLFHNFQQLLLTLLGGPIVEDGDRQWMGDSNSIGYLQQYQECAHKERHFKKN